MKLDEYEIESAMRAGDWRRAADCLMSHFGASDSVPPLEKVSIKVIEYSSWSLTIYYGSTAWYWDDVAGFYTEDFVYPHAPKRTPKVIATYCEDYYLDET